MMRDEIVGKKLIYIRLKKTPKILSNKKNNDQI
jgi:hypothetical protein